MIKILLIIALIPVLIILIIENAFAHATLAGLSLIILFIATIADARRSRRMAEEHWRRLD